MIYRLIYKPADLLIVNDYIVIYWLIDLHVLTGWFTDWLIYRLIDLLTDWFTDWFTVWLMY